MRLPTGFLMLVTGLAAPGLGAADYVYKSTMPDGSVIYGESVFPGAKKFEKIAPPPTSTGTLVATPQDKNRADKITSRPGAAVGVLPQAPREAAPPLQSGTMNPPGVMPKRSY